MKYRGITNGIVFVILLTLPLVAELNTATADNVPGTGFDVLLYKPFETAYLLLAGVLFISINFYYSFKTNSSLLYGIGLGSVLLITWFIVAFLSVGQLHLSLGGKL